MRLWLTLTVAAALSAACGGTAVRRVTPTAAPDPLPAITLGPSDPLVIGVSAPLSGDQTPLGRDIADAAELAIAEYGGSLKGHAVHTWSIDDGCADAEKARAAARSLLEIPNLAGVIGPMCTTGAQAADRVYDAAHVIHIAVAATRTDLSSAGEPYFFRTAWRDDAQAQIQASYAYGQLAARTVLLIDDGEPYGRTLADAFAPAFEAQGGRITARQRIERGAPDLTLIARQAVSDGPDAVVFEGLDPEGALLVKALRAAGYLGSFVAPDALLSVRDFITAGGGATDGAIVTGGAEPDDRFNAAFAARIGRAPATSFVLQAYDAVAALLGAADATATRGDGSTVIEREALAASLRSRELHGKTGDIRFDQNGDRSGETATALGLTIYRVTDGSFVPAP